MTAIDADIEPALRYAIMSGKGTIYNIPKCVAEP